ncbi:hypothetical protein [Aquimarina megaterium]|uniref:hypothetical protein n=1 Tax=Aquimarina megaterium TaxID=1443666 RepID=UPI000471C5B1|nr:hypothetical protein [Aquimarina megaterium]
MIYENTYIGTFIYLFGYYAGINGLEKLTSFNLYQQTPKDKTVGDLLSSIGGRNFIFEFKRTKERIKTEFDKKQRVKLLQFLGKNQEYRLLSQKLHFIAYPDNNDFMIDFYIKVKNINNLKPLGFKSFCNGILNDSLSFDSNDTSEKLGGTHDELKKYILLLNQFSPPSKKSGGGRYSGIMVNYNKERNEINFYEYEDILTLKKEIILDLGIENKKTKNIDKDKDYGHYNSL